MALAGEPQNPDPGLFRGSRPVPKERSTSHDRCGSRAIYLYILYSTAVAQLASLSEQNKEAREKNERRGEEEEKKNQIKMRDMCKVAPRVLIGDPRAGPSVFVFFFFFPDSFLFTKKTKACSSTMSNLKMFFYFLKIQQEGTRRNADWSGRFARPFWTEQLKVFIVSSCCWRERASGASECESASEPLEKTPALLPATERKPLLTKRSGPQRHRHITWNDPSAQKDISIWNSQRTAKKRNGRFQMPRSVATGRADRSDGGDRPVRLGRAVRFRPEQ